MVQGHGVGGRLDWMISEAFSTLDDPEPKQFGSSSLRSAQGLFLGVGQEGGLLWVRSAEVGRFELAVARFRAELKVDIAR